MGHYTKLDLFTKTYEMVKLFLPKINRINKSYKYTIGEEGKKAAFQLLSLINLINTSDNASERLKYFKQFMHQYEVIKLCIKLCIDLHLLNAREFSDIFSLLKDINIQAIRWRNSTTKYQTF